MIALDKTFQKEPIPGIIAIVARRVKRRTSDMLGLKIVPFPIEGRNAILAAFDEWEPGRVYSACPFKDVLDAYPGPQDMKKLWDYQKTLDKYMSDDKEMNEWANAIIHIITKELWPDNNWWRE